MESRGEGYIDRQNGPGQPNVAQMIIWGNMTILYVLTEISSFCSQCWSKLCRHLGEPVAIRKQETETSWQRPQMWPCTVWRTSSSPMDTSSPSTPPRPPPRHQPPYPQATRLLRPHRRPSINTKSSWRAFPDTPGQWTAMKGAPLEAMMEPATLKSMLEAVPTTMNPGTGVNPGRTVWAGAKLTSTLWEILW